MVKNLKYLRNQRGISQQKLAAEIGISQQSVNKYENHSIEPDISVLIALADYFDVSVDYLIGRSEVNTLSLSEDEKFISDYKKLTPNQQECISAVMAAFIDKK